LKVSSNTELAEQMLLERDWVNHNIKKSMRTFLKEVREKEGHTGFVYIPKGDNKPHAPGTVSSLGISPTVE
jgi:mevalonate pyrophosphate decarboxylase